MSCTASPRCAFTEVPLEQIDVQWGGEAVGRKAVAYPKRKVIIIDPAFWRSLKTVDARAAIMAHERGHIEGARCESCADRRAGEILRREGHTQPRDAARALLGRLENRDGEQAASDLLDGFGLDDLPSGAGYLLNIGRAQGITGPHVLALLRHLHANGLTVNGVTYSLTVGVDGGVRTAQRQLELYAKGRAQNADGTWRVVDATQVVTNIKDATGNHPKGRAVDLWVMLPSGEPLLYPKQSPLFEQLYAALGALGESLGCVWGGRWTSLVDRPHFEEPKGNIITPKTAAVAGVVLLIIAATVALS